jgi:hypothetical protein
VVLTRPVERRIGALASAGRSRTALDAAITMSRRVTMTGLFMSFPPDVGSAPGRYEPRIVLLGRGLRGKAFQRAAGPFALWCRGSAAAAEAGNAAQTAMHSTSASRGVTAWRVIGS